MEQDGHLFGMSWSDLGHAALSLSSAIPLVGNAATAIRWGKRGADALDTVGYISRNLDTTQKFVGNGADTLRGLDNAGDAAGDAARRTPSNSDTPSATREAPSGQSVATSCGRNSFVPGTRVVLADGSSKPIEQLQVGDRVLATDVESGDNQARTVTNVRSHTGDKDPVTVTVDTDGDNGTQTGSFTATADHPIWLPDAGTWAPAGQLQPGMWLQTGAGTWVQVTAVQHHHAGHQQVHNLTVHGVHTYYILAGSAPVLVHNCGEGPLRPGVADTRPAVGSGPSHHYQVAHAGPCEQLCVGGGSQVWADGIEGISTLLDAKYVGNPGRSPFVPGSAIPDKIRGFINAKIESEFSRYADVINDPTTPFERLRVITNEPGAVPYFEGLLSRFGIPGEVVVR